MLNTHFHGALVYSITILKLWFPRPAASASPETLLEMQISTQSETLGVGPVACALTNPLGDSDAFTKVEELLLYLYLFHFTQFKPYYRTETSTAGVISSLQLEGHNQETEKIVFYFCHPSAFNHAVLSHIFPFLNNMLGRSPNF